MDEFMNIFLGSKNPIKETNKNESQTKKTEEEMKTKGREVVMREVLISEEDDDCPPFLT